MKRLGFATLAVTVCAIGLARAEPADAPPEVQVGVFLSMTGPAASFGVATLEGIQLAVDEERRKRSGRAVKLTVLDTAGKASDVPTVVTTLVDGGAIVLLGEVASSLSLAGAAIAQKRGVPMMTPSSTNARVTDAGDMISRACFVDAFQGYAMAKFARDQLRVSKVATLADGDAVYSKELAAAFETAFVALGGTIVSSEQYRGGDTDVKVQLDAIRAAKAQAVYIPGFYTDVGVIARQVRDVGIKIPLLGGDGWESDQLVKIAGAAIEGSYFTSHFAVDSPAAKAFVTAFRTKYKHDPDALAALGYDAAKLLIDALARSPSTKGADLGAAIRSTKKFAGVTGTISIDASGTTSKSAVVMRLAGGKPVLAGTIAPK